MHSKFFSCIALFLVVLSSAVAQTVDSVKITSTVNRFRGANINASIHSTLTQPGTVTGTIWASYANEPFQDVGSELFSNASSLEYLYGSVCLLPDTVNSGSIQIYVTARMGNGVDIHSDTISIVVNNTPTYSFGLHEVYRNDNNCDSTHSYQKLVYYGPTLALNELEMIHNINTPWYIDSMYITVNGNSLISGYDTVQHTNGINRVVVFYPDNNTVLNNGDTVELRAATNNIQPFSYGYWGDFSMVDTSTGTLYSPEFCTDRFVMPSYHNTPCGGTSQNYTADIWLDQDTVYQKGYNLANYDISADVNLWEGPSIYILLGIGNLIDQGPEQDDYPISSDPCFFGEMDKDFSFTDDNTGAVLKDTTLTYTNVKVATDSIIGVGATTITVRHELLLSQFPAYADGQSGGIRVQNSFGNLVKIEHFNATTNPHDIVITGLSPSTSYTLSAFLEDPNGDPHMIGCFSQFGGFVSDVNVQTKPCLISTLQYTSYNSGNNTLSFTLSFPQAMAGDLVNITTPDSVHQILLVADTVIAGLAQMSVSVDVLIGETVWLINPCGQNQSYTVTATGVEEIIDSRPDDIKAYPNPTSGLVSIEGIVRESKYSVHSISGRMIFNGETQENFKIDLSQLPQGVYLLSVVNEKGKIIKRIIKN